jgi:hypothetical protein
LNNTFALSSRTMYKSTKRVLCEYARKKVRALTLGMYTAARTKTTVPSASVQLIEKRKLATIKALGDEGELSLRMRTGVS